MVTKNVVQAICRLFQILNEYCRQFGKIIFYYKNMNWDHLFYINLIWVSSRMINAKLKLELKFSNGNAHYCNVPEQK